MSRRGWISGTSALAVLAALALMAACSDDAAEPFALAPCQNLPPAELSGAPTFTLEELGPALRDVATRLAGALPAGELRDDLRTAVGRLGAAPGSRDTACRLFLLSRESLKRLEGLEQSNPGMRPDCAAIRLVLDLSAAALAREGS